VPEGLPLRQSTKPAKKSAPPIIDPVEVRGLGSGRRPESGPIEVRGLDGQYRPESGPIEVRGLDGQYRPGSGPIEVRGLDGQYRPGSGPIEVRGLTDTPSSNAVSEDFQGRSTTRADVPKYLCPLDELPDNAVLALSFFRSHGTLFMVAGTELTPRTISMLNNLHELGHHEENVWLEYHKATA